MTKIAYVLKMYPRFSETFIVNEILELERQGIDVHIYALMLPNDGRFHAMLADVKAPVTYVPQYPQFEIERIRTDHAFVRETCPAGYSQAYDYLQKHNTDATNKRFLQAGCIAAALLRNPVDGMHAHFASSAARVSNLVNLMIGTPYSITAHAKDIYHQDVRPRSLANKLSNARYVVTVSHYNKTYLEDMLGDTSADIRVLYNGVDVEKFRPQPSQHRQRNEILAVGRLVEKKGFEVLIDACALLKSENIDFTCRIVGKGKLRLKLAAKIAQLGLEDQIELAGALTQEQVLSAYHTATVFTLPCVIAQDGNRDGLPTVLLEAMATGLPVVTTTVTGNTEIVKHGRTGLLTPPNDASTLAGMLKEVLTNEQLQFELGQAARKTVLDLFDVRSNVSVLATWFQETTSPTPKTRFSGELPALPELEMESKSPQTLVLQL